MGNIYCICDARMIWCWLILQKSYLIKRWRSFLFFLKKIWWTLDDRCFFPKVDRDFAWSKWTKTELFYEEIGMKNIFQNDTRMCKSNSARSDYVTGKWGETLDVDLGWWEAVLVGPRRGFGAHKGLSKRRHFWSL